jgi:chemotaxis protein histidine kinase CheA
MTPDPGDATPAPLSTTLAQLRESYRMGASTLVARFRELAAQLATDPSSSAVTDAVRQASHRVRGTAGSYGFDRASELAGALEDRAAGWAIDPGAERDIRAEVVAQFADSLEVAFEAV